MREQIKLLSRQCAAILFFAVFITLMMSSVYIDVNWMHNALYESSITELAQEVMLALIAGGFYFSASRRPELRGALILIGGFYTCMLIRELDFIFDMIFHGSWVIFALLTALASLATAMKSPESILSGLVRFTGHKTWLMTATGLLIVLVFSRLFGMHQLWQNLMLDGYNRVVKNMAEEGTELLGYSICFLASANYLWSTRPAVVQDKISDDDAYRGHAQPPFRHLTNARHPQ